MNDDSSLPLTEAPGKNGARTTHYSFVLRLLSDNAGKRKLPGQKNQLSFRDETMTMKRILFVFFFIGLMLFSWIVLAGSMGWLLVFFGIVLFPLMVVHILAISKTMKRWPFLNGLMSLSSLAMVAFSLIRPDTDDVNSYTGLSSFLHHFAGRTSQYTHISDVHFYFALALLLSTIVLDIMILYKGRRPPVVPSQNDFV